MKYAWITKHKKRFPIKQMCRVLNVSVSNYYAQLKCERSQYTSDAYQKTLGTMGITCSMSRKGNCYDNAVMERFFCSLKGEWTNHEVYADLPAARISVFKYIWKCASKRLPFCASNRVPPRLKE